jgi:potassium-dependent mechanosensitive channel
MSFGPIIRAFLTACVLLLHFGFAHAFDNTTLLSAEREASGMRSDLERVQSVVDQEGVTDDQLAEQRSVVEELRLNAVGEVAKISPSLDAVKQQLNQLGPPPTQGQTEAATIAVQRSELGDAVSRFTAAKKQFELIGLEAEQMSGKVSAQQRTQFFQRIFKPDKSILNPQLWRDAATGTSLLSVRLSSLISIWWQNQAPNAQWAGLLLLPAVIAAVWSLYRFLSSNFGKWMPKRSEGDLELSPLRRLWRVTWGMFGLIVAVGLLNLLVAASLDVSNLVTPRFFLVVGAILGVLTSCLINSGLAYLICAPGKPTARLIAVDERAARAIPIFVLLASFVQSLATQITGLSDQLLLPVSLVAGQSAIAAATLIGLAGLMLVLLKRQANTPPVDVPEPHYLSWFVNFMPLLWLLLAVAVFGLIFGYLALAYFIAGKILDTVLVVVVIVLVHHLIDALSDTLQNPASYLGQQLRRMTSIGDRGISRLSLTFRTVADVLLVGLGIPWLLALWTVTWVDFRSLFNNAVVGFRIGNITVSPLNLVSLLGILTAGILLTRFITGWLDKRVLTQTRLNKGVQDSVRTGANYAGYILAGAFALSAGGFDFSSFTIIAGALGVGIGFGLQSIVNNFVSGLILLAERPVRVGDWIVAGAGEGIVKKINVRSTEIETFDNCTIIVPNSNLITEAVRNWTHRDTLGRFLVTVGVAHGTDADAVAKTLTEIVTAHPKVLRYPPAQVQLARFAPGTMDFEVRGHVADVFEAAQVSSELRFAISKSFTEKKFIIPTTAEVLAKK